jgi:Protein kinase domain
VNLYNSAPSIPFSFNGEIHEPSFYVPSAPLANQKRQRIDIHQPKNPSPSKKVRRFAQRNNDRIVTQLENGNFQNEPVLSEYEKNRLLIIKVEQFVLRFGKEYPRDHKKFEFDRSGKITCRVLQLYNYADQILAQSFPINQKIADRYQGQTFYAYDVTSSGIFGITGHEIGFGASKVAKISFNLATKELFARVTAPLIKKKASIFMINSIKKEVEIQNLFHGFEQFVQMIYSFQYTSKKGFQKIAMGMEYCDQGKLENYMESIDIQNLTENQRNQLIGFFKGIFFALWMMELKGIDHRDIKPSNIFLKTNSNGDLQAKVGDFGFAKRKEEKGNLSGTPFYSSVENLLYCDSSKTDIWAVGIILYRLLYKTMLWEDLKGQSIIDMVEFMQFIITVDQEIINQKCDQKIFSDPFLKGLQLILKSILIIQKNKRPSAREVYRTYCKQFGLQPQHPFRSF